MIREFFKLILWSRFTIKSSIPGWGTLVRRLRDFRREPNQYYLVNNAAECETRKTDWREVMLGLYRLGRAAGIEPITDWSVMLPIEDPIDWFKEIREKLEALAAENERLSNSLKSLKLDFDAVFAKYADAKRMLRQVDYSPSAKLVADIEVFLEESNK